VVGKRRHPSDQAIADLLDSVRKARTTLAIDLSAAAGALDENRPEIARDIVSAVSNDVASIGSRVRAHQTEPASTGQSIRNRRVLLALPIVPLVGAIAMTAAAALGGSSHDTTHNNHHVLAVAAHRPTVVVPLPASATAAATSAAHAAAATTLHRLEHVVSHDPRASQVLAVADDLHQQLTAMIATATDNPARLHVVRQLLALEQHVLESSKVPGTQLALAASREIAWLLEHRPSAHSAPSVSSPPTARETTTPQPTPPTSGISHTTHRNQPHAPKHLTAGNTPRSTPSDTLFGKGIFGSH
jgi:hypothetical protein